MQYIKDKRYIGDLYANMFHEINIHLNLLTPLPFNLRKGRAKKGDCVRGAQISGAKSSLGLNFVRWRWMFWGPCYGFAVRHLSGCSNLEMAVRLLEGLWAPALRNAHYTRRLKFGHFSLCVNIYYYVTEFISIYHVLYLYTFCILYRQIMLNTKTIYTPALCAVKPTWFIVRCNTVCVGVKNSRNTSVTPNWGFRNSGQTRSTLTWHA